ncbi:hypothetical protein ACF05T_26925 [Streptomyces lateritius]|uniref:Uncharacterized protein n=1 Tax=Streptomyces lateritius TaxID=67313 RepID=A0ABW6YJR5_9ACTN
MTAVLLGEVGPAVADPVALGERPASTRPPRITMDVASELPAVVISRLLGFHQSTGDNWTRESQGYGAEYAADIIRR